MNTPFQLSEKILRDERMTLSSCPWAINFAYTGTAPADLENERRRTIYEAIKEADRDLRRQFHMRSPKTLIETVKLTLDSTERPFPIPYMRYIELVLDSQGRHIPVVGYTTEPSINRARWKQLGYSNPPRESPFRAMITRPGYWKLAPSGSSQEVTVKFIREHGFWDIPMWYDEGAASSVWTPTGAPVVTVNDDSSDWCETLFYGAGAVPLGKSTRFDFAASGVTYLLAYMDITGKLPVARAGYNLEFWTKTKNGTIPDTLSLILSLSATCLTADYVLPVVGVSMGGEWYKFSSPIQTTATGLKTLGLRANGTVIAGSLWLDRMVYTQIEGSRGALYGPNEYVENLLPLKARAILNFNTKNGSAEALDAKVEKAIQDFAMSDGSGERPRRLIVRVP